MMFRDPTPVALWRDTILFWCRMAEVQRDAGFALWASLLPAPAEPAERVVTQPAALQKARPDTQPRPARRARALASVD